MGKWNFTETPVAKVSEDIRDNGRKSVVAQMKQQQQEEEKTDDTQTVADDKQVPAAPAKSADKPSKRKTSTAKVPKVDTAQQSDPLMGQKEETNGIVIDVPMSDYMQLLMLKMRKKTTLKKLALQAIHEFVERNKIG